MAQAFSKRITAFNAVDFATAGAWYTNMYYRATGEGDLGKIYNRSAVPQTTPPLHEDRWNVFLNACSRPPSVPYNPVGGLLQPIPWAAGTIDEQAAILTFITPARSRAVGADPTMTQQSNGLTEFEEAVFTSAIDCFAKYGFTEGQYYHSGEFNYTIGSNFKFWSDILNEIKAQ